MEGFIWLQTSQKRFEILIDWLNKARIFLLVDLRTLLL